MVSAGTLRTKVIILSKFGSFVAHDPTGQVDQAAYKASSFCTRILAKRCAWQTPQSTTTELGSVSAWMVQDSGCTRRVAHTHRRRKHLPWWQYQRHQQRQHQQQCKEQHCQDQRLHHRLPGFGPTVSPLHPSLSLRTRRRRLLASWLSFVSVLL